MPLIDKTIPNETIFKKGAIIFVHGLNGSMSTWEGQNKFIDSIHQYKEITDFYNIYQFTYGTKIFEFRWINRLLLMLPSKKNASKSFGFNIGIRRISNELVAAVDQLDSNIQSIVFITHSLGGLITKKTLVDLPDYNIKKVRAYFSLSVPHNGAFLARFAKGIGLSNPQIKDVLSNGEFVTELGAHFTDMIHKNSHLKMVFQSGSYDEIVPELSAFPALATQSNRITTADNHYSVLTVSEPSINLAFNRVLSELRSIMEFSSSSEKANIPFNFDIPNKATFYQIAKTIVADCDCTVDFIGINDSVLNIELMSQTVQAENLYDGINKLQTLGKSGHIPKYKISINGSKIVISKITSVQNVFD